MRLGARINGTQTSYGDAAVANEVLLAWVPSMANASPI